MTLKCLWSEFFYYQIWKRFQCDKEWHLFDCDSTLGSRVIQEFDLCKLDDLWHHIVDTKWCKITIWNICANNNSTGLKFFRVDVLQEPHILIMVMMSPKQHTCYQTSTFLKWKLPYLLLQSLTDFLVLVLCNVHIHSHPLNEQQEQITLLEGGNSAFPFEWRGPGTHCVTMEMSQCTYHGTLWWV